MKNTKGMRVATAWRLCLKMWDRHYEIHKVAWCRENGYKLVNDCFFCDYAVRQESKIRKEDPRFVYGPFSTCLYCPARIIAPTFICESERPYNWLDFPGEFCAKLHSMDKKRLQMNREMRSK